LVVLLPVVYVTIGGALFYAAEGWLPMDAFHFSAMLVSSVG
jgi:hypothetical protein